jgi:predicted Rossmann fold flavoprotein
MTRKEVIIIGGGMAGMAACVHAASEGINVTLLERNRTLGKKLLITGSGQCNITHGGNIRDFEAHYGRKSGFLRHALFSYPNTHLITFFEKLGIRFVEDENHKVFPASYKAIEIRDRFLDACIAAHTIVRSESRVLTVTHENGRFTVTGDSLDARADALVVATGGASYPSTGSTGDGYTIAASLGHTIVEPRPSLAPVYSEDFALKSLAGLTFPACTIRLWRAGRKLSEYEGSLLITHTGLSGPVILDNSRDMRGGDTIEIAFVSDSAAEKFSSKLVERKQGEGTLLVKTLMTQTGLPRHLSETILGFAGVESDTTVSMLGREQRKALVKMICGFGVPVSKVGGFEEAFSTSGGVETAEINPKTMESRIIKNLFFAGEVIDYDGDTGGYGLQAAFSTGALCGCSIQKLPESL